MRKALLPLAYLLPFVAFAQADPTLNGLVPAISTLIQNLTPIVVALALLVFFWGLVRYIFAAGSGGADKTKAVNTMIWSVIALFVMVSVWGIVRLIGRTVGIDEVQTVPVPRVL